MTYRKSEDTAAFRPTRLDGLCAIAMATIALAPAANAEAASGATVVQLIDPTTVSPLIGAAPWNANGPAEHRMVVSHQGDGATYLDMGYNSYKKGVRLSTPYAYKTDEICFLPSGRIRMEDEDGSTYERGAGRLMWRPAGGVTRSAEFLEDTVTICSMAPARLDANGHRVLPQDVGKWSGSPETKPRPHWYPMSEGPVITKMDSSASPGVVEHEVLSRRKDGSAKESVVYVTLEKGAHLALSSAGEQICWVENGPLALSSGGVSRTAKPNTFFFRPDGVKVDLVKALSKAAMTCFSGPASF
jgi:hypothetical protein